MEAPEPATPFLPAALQRQASSLRSGSASSPARSQRQRQPPQRQLSASMSRLAQRYNIDGEDIARLLRNPSTVHDLPRTSSAAASPRNITGLRRPVQKIRSQRWFREAEGDDSGDAGVGSPSELEYNHAAGSPPESAQDMRRVARLLVLPFVQHAADTAAATKIIESAAQNAAAAASEQAPQPTSALKKATSAGSQLRQAGSVKFATSPSRSASQPGLPSRPGTQPATSLASPISTSLLAVSPNLPAVELVGGRRSRQLTPSGSAAGTPLVGSRSAMLLPGAEQTAATLAEEPPPKAPAARPKHKTPPPPSRQYVDWSTLDKNISPLELAQLLVRDGDIGLVASLAQRLNDLPPERKLTGWEVKHAAYRAAKNAAEAAAQAAAQAEADAKRVGFVFSNAGRERKSDRFMNAVLMRNIEHAKGGKQQPGGGKQVETPASIRHHAKYQPRSAPEAPAAVAVEQGGEVAEELPLRFEDVVVGLQGTLDWAAKLHHAEETRKAQQRIALAAREIIPIKAGREGTWGYNCTFASPNKQA